MIAAIEALAVMTCNNVHYLSRRRSPGHGLSRRPILPRPTLHEKQKLTCTPGGGRGSREIFIGRAEPQVDGALDASGAEGEADLHAHPGRAIAGQENFPDDPAVLAGGDRGLLAVGTAGEVVHFLGEAVVPELLLDGVRPALGGRGLLDGVAVARLAVGRQGVAHVQVGEGQSSFAVNLDPVIHTAPAGPAILNQADGVPGELEDAEGVVLAAGLVAVHIRAHLAVDTLDHRPVEEPIAKGDSMATHVHEHAASRFLDIPEPVAVGAKVLLALLDEVDLSSRVAIARRLPRHIVLIIAQRAGLSPM